MTILWEVVVIVVVVVVSVVVVVVVVVVRVSHPNSYGHSDTLFE